MKKRLTDTEDKLVAARWEGSSGSGCKRCRDEEAQIGSYESQGLECSIGYVVGIIVRVVDGC